jgi:kynurenine formamidase
LEYQTTFRFNDQQYSVDLQSPISIARSPTITNQTFDLSDLSVQRVPFKQPNFIGDVGAGGSCNVDVLKIIPHCGTTHTETVLHVLDRNQWPLEKVSITSIPPMVFLPCVVVGCDFTTGVQAVKHGQTYQPNLADGDLVVTSQTLTKSLSALNLCLTSINTPFAMVIKTAAPHQLWSYGSEEPVPFFSNEAMTLIAASGCRHLLVDFPSVDRSDDGGRLSNHRTFWNVPPAGKPPKLSPSKVDSSSNAATLDDFNLERTITELVAVPSEVVDGVYLLNLQTAPLNTDATLSRPVLFKAHA